MAIIALDIHPQHRFTCMAANEPHFLHRPEHIVNELNLQASFSNKRLLIKNIGSAADTFCRICIQTATNPSKTFHSIRNHFGASTNGCSGIRLFGGLPLPADYDHEIETHGNFRHGACFHDIEENHSTGLMEWLYTNHADTVILGGLSTEETIFHTAKQLRWYNKNMNIIVNIAACCGYTPESTIQTIYRMHELGIQTVNSAAELTNHFKRSLFKVS